jgi:hypothetical protein
MSRLAKSLNAWAKPNFEDVLRNELEQIDAAQLPLQQGLTTTSDVADSKRTVRIISVADGDECIRVKAGIFYAGIVAGCSCADDPTPVNEQPEYCEVLLEIDKTTAATKITLLS